MNKKLMIVVLFVLLACGSLFAVDGGDVAKDMAKGTDAGTIFLWSIIVGACALALTASVGALAQSKALSTACENIGRNPAAAGDIRTALIIGLALIESLVIYVLLVDLIIFFVKWGQYTVK